MRPVPEIRTGQAGSALWERFGTRFRQRFDDPAFEAGKEFIRRIEVVAWEAYEGGLHRCRQYFGTRPRHRILRALIDSHDTLDRDEAVREQACNVARSVVAAVAELRAGRLSRSDARLRPLRPK